MGRADVLQLWKKLILVTAQGKSSWARCNAKGVMLSSGSAPITDGSSITLFIRKMLVSSVQITSGLLTSTINSMLYTPEGLGFWCSAKGN